jgi:hypothetical protein
MIDISLNEKTKHVIERSTGISFSELKKLDIQNIEKRIEVKIKTPIMRNYKNHDRRLPARGGVFLALKRYIKLSDIDKKLNKI